MGNSLADQLLKAGMVNKQQARKAKAVKQKQERQRRHNKAETVDEAKILAEKAQAEKVARDRELNRQRKESAERKAIAAQVRQLIESNRIEVEPGELAFNFTVDSVIKTLRVTPTVHQQLTRGSLAIAALADRFEIIPRPVADKISERAEEAIVYMGSEQADNEQDDAYAGYEIPDDLMW
ncbi:MAG TPA: DUF2058 domain-containing protein [Gammaproteobacteria bacterium]|nr:DUF2058 domain-containing protein [Gammaproteobacteria bacterium]